MAPHGRELSEDLKSRIIALHKDGQGYRKIATTLTLSNNTVAKVIQRYLQNHTVANRTRQGRPKKMSARTSRQARQLALQDRRRSATSIAEEISITSGMAVSAQTIRRTLHQASIYGCRPRWKPLLKPTHKTARMKFAKDHQSKPKTFWHHILWSDESKINLFGSDGVKFVWRGPDEQYKDKCVTPTVKHGGGGIMVWGCMSAAGTGEIKIIDGVMDSTMYCDILKEKMVPSLKKLGPRATFQHDNDPKHSSKQTTAFLKKQKVKVLEWPSMSPDLNPIEHLWGVLKDKVAERKVSNIRQLQEVVVEE